MPGASSYLTIPGSDGDPVLPAMLRVAGEPTRWDELIDVLQASPPMDDARAEAALEVLTTLAALSRNAGEGSELDSAPQELGVILVAPNGRVMAVNALARIAMEGLGDVEPGEPLTFHDDDNAATASAALRRAQHDRTRVAFRLQAPDGHGPRFAYAAPAANLIRASAPPKLGTLLIFAASEGCETWTLVRTSFGLTEAELTLTRALCEGLSLSQAAGQLSVSVHTVRNQLRAIFDKMGLQRQSDLVRAVHELDRIGGALAAPARADVEAPPLQRMRLPDGRILAWREYGDPAAPRTLLSFHEGLGSSLLPPGTDARARALGLRVMCPERPGFGQSDPLPGPYDFDHIAEDMVCLLDARGVGRVRIGAVLSGTPAALHTAARLGDRVDLVMLCSGRPPGRVRPHRKLSLGARVRAGLEAHPWAADALFAIIRLRRSHGLTRQILAHSTAHSPGDAAYLAEDPAFADYVCAYVGESLDRTSRGVAEEVKAFRRGENAPRPEFAAPLVVWHGAEDAFAPLDDLLAYVGQPSEVRVFDRIGHFLAAKHWHEILERLAA